MATGLFNLQIPLDASRQASPCRGVGKNLRRLIFLTRFPPADKVPSMNTKHMKATLELARTAVDLGDGGPFAAIIVRDDVVVGRGWNRVVAGCDPTAHAEMEAIRDACARLQTFSLKGCELYASCEPCPMCLAAIYWARLDRLYYAADRHDAARGGFDDAYFYDQARLDPDQRDLPSEQGLAGEGRQVFDLWLQKTDRARY